jgi:hypothetical protein
MAGNWNSGRKPRELPVSVGPYEPPIKPLEMDDYQRWLWDTVVARLIELRVVERGDEDGLCMMLRAWSAFQGAMNQGDTVEAMRAGDFYRKLKAQYGVNRVSRSKIGIPAKGEAEAIRPRKRK